jgi:chitinase
MPTVANPTFNPVAGAYPSTDYPKPVQIVCATGGAYIRCTTDGTTPTPTYGNLIEASTGTVSVSANVNLKAMAYRAGYVNSAVVVGTYSVLAKVATPTFAPDSQTSSLHSVSVRISCSTSGATIRYTTDGSTPTSTHGTIITSGSSVTIFPPAAGMTLKAIGYKSGLTNSAVKSAGYYWDPSGGL